MMRRQPCFSSTPSSLRQRRAVRAITTGPLVVVHAAAVEAAVPTESGAVGVGVPALALAHHVQVAQDIQGAGQRVEAGGAHGAAVYFGLKAVFTAHGQGLVQGRARARAEGRAGRALAADALHGHQAAYVAYQLVPVGVNPLGDALFKFHPLSAPSCASRPRRISSPRRR